MEKSILLHCLTPKELKEYIKEALKEELEDFKKNLNLKEDDVLLTRAETCEFLKIDSSTLWHWTKKGKITCYGIANRRFYKKADILNSLVLLKTK